MPDRVRIAEVVAVPWCPTLALASQAAASDRPDFSEIWQLNEALSEGPHDKALEG
jgi:hypothetical protein